MYLWLSDKKETTSAVWCSVRAYVCVCVCYAIFCINMFLNKRGASRKCEKREIQ